MDLRRKLRFIFLSQLILAGFLFVLSVYNFNQNSISTTDNTVISDNTPKDNTVIDEKKSEAFYDNQLANNTPTKSAELAVNNNLKNDLVIDNNSNNNVINPNPVIDSVNNPPANTNQPANNSSATNDQNLKKPDLTNFEQEVIYHLDIANPIPFTSSDTSIFSLEEDQSKVVTFYVQNTGGDAGKSYIDFSYSSGLSCEAPSTPYNLTGDWIPYGPGTSNPKIWDKNDNYITATYNLYSFYTSNIPNSSYLRSFTAKFTAKSGNTGSQWVKYRVSMKKNNGTNDYVRYPTSSSYTDQQGYDVVQIDGSIKAKPLIHETSYIDPTLLTPSESFTGNYWIYNYNSYSIQVGLGLSIRKVGTTTEFSDITHDTPYIWVSPSSQYYDKYTRIFDLSKATDFSGNYPTAGNYEYNLGIWSGAPGSSIWYGSTGWKSGLKINNRPILSGPTIEPSSSGYTNTSFTFRVNYTDQDNEAPTLKTVRVDGIDYDMDKSDWLDFNYADGMRYHKTLSGFLRGNKAIKYIFTDGNFPNVEQDGGSVTIENRAPNKPTGGSSSASGTSATLSWNSVSDPDGDPITYDLYLGTSSSSLSIPSGGSGLTSTSCNLTNLSYSTMYFWKIVAKDNYSTPATNSSDVWSFTTPEPPQGDLEVIIRNVTNGQSGIPGDNGFIEVYKSDGTKVAEHKTDNKNGDGTYTFSSLPVGDYYIKSYYNSASPWGREFWGQSETKTIIANSCQQIDFTRNNPYLKDVKFFQNNDRLYASSKILPNSQVRAEVELFNPKAFAVTVSSTVCLDSNQSFPCDLEQSQSVSILPNSSTTTNLYFTPQNEAIYFRTAKLEYGNVTTDGWLWEQALEVYQPKGDLDVIVKNVSYGKIGIPGTNAEVRLYKSDGIFVSKVDNTKLENARGDGKAEFKNLDIGNYYVEVVFKAGDWGYEIWGISDNFEILENTDNRFDFTRSEPVAKDVKFYNATSNAVVDLDYPLALGQSVKAIIKVKNNKNEEISGVWARARISIVEDSFDGDTDKISPQQTVAADQELSFEVILKPSSAGIYGRDIGVFHDETQYDIVDGWEWLPNAFRVVEAPEDLIEVNKVIWNNQLGYFISTNYVDSDVTYDNGKSRFDLKIINNEDFTKIYHLTGPGVNAASNPGIPDPVNNTTEFTLNSNEEKTIQVFPRGISNSADETVINTLEWQLTNITNNRTVTISTNLTVYTRFFDYFGYVLNNNHHPAGKVAWTHDLENLVFLLLGKGVAEPVTTVISDKEAFCLIPIIKNDGSQEAQLCQEAGLNIALLALPVERVINPLFKFSGSLGKFAIQHIDDAVRQASGNTKTVIEELSKAGKTALTSHDSLAKIIQGIQRIEVYGKSGLSQPSNVIEKLSVKETYNSIYDDLGNLILQNMGDNSEKLLAKSAAEGGVVPYQIIKDGTTYLSHNVIYNKGFGYAGYTFGRESADLVFNDRNGEILLELTKSADHVEVDLLGSKIESGINRLFVGFTKYAHGTGAEDVEVKLFEQVIGKASQNVAGNLNQIAKLAGKPGFKSWMIQNGHQETIFINHIGNIWDGTDLGKKAIKPLSENEKNIINNFATRLSAKYSEFRLITIDLDGMIINTHANHPGGIYNYPVTATLHSDLPATIYYTLDGSEPTTHSVVYSNPIPIINNTTIKYFAQDNNGNHSDIEEADYVILNPNSFPSPTIDTNNGANFTTTDRHIILEGQTVADTESILVNGSTQGVGFTSGVYTWRYEGNLSEGENSFAITANNIASVTSASTNIIITLDTQAPIISVTPTGGIYSSAQQVTLSTNEPATIYFTTEGSIPTEASTIYSEPINISQTTTLKFFAKDSTGNSSEIQTEEYIIDLNTTYTDSAYSEQAARWVRKAMVIWHPRTKLNRGIIKEIGNLLTTSSSIVDFSIDVYKNNQLAYSGMVSGKYAWTTTIKPNLSYSKDDEIKLVINGITDDFCLTGQDVAWFETSSQYPPLDPYLTIVYQADTQAPQVSALPTGGLYQSEISVNLTSDDPDAAIYWRVWGKDILYEIPPAWQIYSEPITIGDEEIEKLGGKLEFYGIDKAGNQSKMQEEIYLIDNEPPIVFSSIPSGTYTSTQQVVLTVNESGAKIYYTIDNSVPSNQSQLYTYPIEIARTTTLKFIAIDLAGNSSSVGIVDFKINTYKIRLTPGKWKMISVNSPITLPIFSEIDVRKFNHATGQYESVSSSQLQPGIGYWMRTTSTNHLDIPIGDYDQSQSVVYNEGFGIVSGYFLKYQDQLKFNDGSTTKTLPEAINAGWIKYMAYYYDNDTYTGLDLRSMTSDDVLGRSFWLRFYKPLTISFDGSWQSPPQNLVKEIPKL